MTRPAEHVSALTLAGQCLRDLLPSRQARALRREASRLVRLEIWPAGTDHLRPKEIRP